MKSILARWLSKAKYLKKAAFGLGLLTVAGATLALTDDGIRQNLRQYIERERSKEHSLFLVYNSRNALQATNAKFQMDLLKQMQAKKPRQERQRVSLLDVSNEGQAQTLIRQFAVNAQSAQPKLYTKINNMVLKVPKTSASNEDQISQFIRSRTEPIVASTKRDVVEAVRSGTKEHFDSVIVCCFSDKAWEDLLSDKKTEAAIRYLMATHNGLVRVRSSELGKGLHLDDDTFYRYYKPSFMNGYGKAYSLDMAYWQVVNGECRDCLKPNFAGTVESLEKLIQQPNVTYTQAREVVDSIFPSSGDVEFHFSRSYKQLLAQGPNAKPIVYIYWDKDSIVQPFLENLGTMACKYDSMCDFVFSSDFHKSAKWFNMNESVEMFPYILIVDPQHTTPVKPPSATEPVAYFPAVYSDVLFIVGSEAERTSFIDKFLAGQLPYLAQSRRMARPSLVKRINKESFESEFLHNDNVDQCIIQIYKHSCASCYYNSKSFDALGWKLKKQKLDKKLPLYMMHTTNDVPELGTFPYTPMYLHVKKEGPPRHKQITAITTLESPMKFEDFKSQLERASGFDLTGLFIDPKRQFEAYLKREDKAEGFDFDFDRIPLPPQPNSSSQSPSSPQLSSISPSTPSSIASPTPSSPSLSLSPSSSISASASASTPPPSPAPPPVSQVPTAGNQEQPNVAKEQKQSSKP